MGTEVADGLNVDKCKVMHVVGNSSANTKYYIEGSDISDVSLEKDLGVWISECEML